MCDPKYPPEAMDEWWAAGCPRNSDGDPVMPPEVCQLTEEEREVCEGCKYFDEETGDCKHPEGD